MKGSAAQGIPGDRHKVVIDGVVYYSLHATARLLALSDAQLRAHLRSGRLAYKIFPGRAKPLVPAESVRMYKCFHPHDGDEPWVAPDG